MCSLGEQDLPALPLWRLITEMWIWAFGFITKLWKQSMVSRFLESSTANL